MIKLSCFDAVGKALSWEGDLKDQELAVKEQLKGLDEELKIINENEAYILQKKRLKMALEYDNGKSILETAFYKGDMSVKEWEWFCSEI
jgi:hypothetical protein